LQQPAVTKQFEIEIRRAGSPSHEPMRLTVCPKWVTAEALGRSGIEISSYKTSCISRLERQLEKTNKNGERVSTIFSAT